MWNTDSSSPKPARKNTAEVAGTSGPVTEALATSTGPPSSSGLYSSQSSDGCSTPPLSNPVWTAPEAVAVLPGAVVVAVEALTATTPHLLTLAPRHPRTPKRQAPKPPEQLPRRRNKVGAQVSGPGL